MLIHLFCSLFKGHSVRLFGQKKLEGKKTGGASLSLPKVRKNPLIEIIAINTGLVLFKKIIGIIRKIMIHSCF